MASKESPPNTMFLEKVIAEYQLDSTHPSVCMSGFAYITPQSIICSSDQVNQRLGLDSIQFKWNIIRYVESYLVSPHDASSIFPQSMRSTRSKRSALRLVFHIWDKNNTSTIIPLSLWRPSDRSLLYEFISRAMHVYSIRSLLGLYEVQYTNSEMKAKAQEDIIRSFNALHEMIHARSVFLEHMSDILSDFNEYHLQFASSLRGCSRVLEDCAEHGLLLSRAHREAFFSSTLPALLADSISNEIVSAEQTAKTAVLILSGKDFSKVSPQSLLSVQVARCVFVKAALSMLHFGCLDSEGIFGRRQLLSQAVLPKLLKSISSDLSSLIEACIQLVTHLSANEDKKKSTSLPTSLLISSSLSSLSKNEQENENNSKLTFGPLRADGVPVKYGSLSAKEAHSLGLPLPSNILKEIEPFLDPLTAGGLTSPGGLSATVQTRIISHRQTSSISETSLTQLVSSRSNTTRVSNTGVIHLPCVDHSIGSHLHSSKPFDYSQVDLGRLDVQSAVHRHASGLFSRRLENAEILDLANKDSTFYPRPASPELIGYHKAVGNDKEDLTLPLHAPAGLVFRNIQEGHVKMIESIPIPSSTNRENIEIPEDDDGGYRMTPRATTNNKGITITDTDKTFLEDVILNGSSQISLEGHSIVLEIKEISVSLFVALTPILSLKGQVDKSQGPLAMSFLKHGEESNISTRMMQHRITSQDIPETWASESLHPLLHLPHDTEHFSSLEGDNESKADKYDDEVGEVSDDDDNKDDNKDDDGLRTLSNAIMSKSSSLIFSHDVGLGDLLIDVVRDGHKLASALALRVANTIAKLLDIASKAKISHMANKAHTNFCAPVENQGLASSFSSLSSDVTSLSKLSHINERLPYTDSYQSFVDLDNITSENERNYRNPAKFAIRLLTYSSLLDKLVASLRIRQLVGKEIYKILRLRCLKDQLEAILHERELAFSLSTRHLLNVIELISIFEVVH
jgi:hypothetical protein